MPRLLIPVWIVFASCAGGVARAGTCGEEHLTADVAAAAVATVERSLRESHVGSVDGVDPETLLGLVAAARLARNAPTQRELVDSLNRALVHSRDAHLEVRLEASAAAECARLPVEFLWNASGLWVRQGTSAVPTGSRVSALGSVAAPDLETALAQRIPHEVPQWVRAHGGDLLPRIDTLRSLGIVEGSGTVPIDFVTPDGNRRQVRLPLAASAVESSGRPWVAHEIFGARQTAYFRFDRFEYNEELARELDEFLTAADAAGVRKVAIDIRGNPGGDSSVAIALLDALRFDAYSTFAVVPRPSPALAEAIPPLMPASLNPLLEQAGLPAVPLDATTYVLPPPLVLAQLRARIAARPLQHALQARPELFLLTDAGTFSSGALFAGLVRDNSLGRLLGEAPGNSATFNGTEHPVLLAGLPYYLNLSLARLIRPASAADGSASLEPDVTIAVTGQDLAVGRDPVLDYVLSAP